METKSAKPIVVDIQDVIVGKLVVPFHKDLGYVDPHNDQLLEVRVIDVPVIIKVRAEKEIRFDPGKLTSNIECITYSCILLNDLLELETPISELLPNEPKEVSVHINDFMQLSGSDDLPIGWFIHHRDVMCLQVNLKIILRDDLEPLFIDSGTPWGTMIDRVQSHLKLLELENDKKLSNLRSPKDYSRIKSPPAHSISNKSDTEPGNRVDQDFLTSIADLLT
jgi:hypothetical protein